MDCSLLIGVGRRKPTQQTPWIVLQVLACSCKHPVNESQAKQPVHNFLPTTNQSCWGNTDWSGRSTSQIGQWGVIEPEILCLWVWSVVLPLVAHSQELRYHGKQKSMVDPLAPSAHTPWSAALDFSSFVACLITKKGYGIYTKRNEGTTDLCKKRNHTFMCVCVWASVRTCTQTASLLQAILHGPGRSLFPCAPCMALVCLWLGLYDSQWRHDLPGLFPSRCPQPQSWDVH